MQLRTGTEEANMMERKFNTLGVSMWSLALHGTFMDAISDLLEDMRDLENLEEGPGLCTKRRMQRTSPEACGRLYSPAVRRGWRLDTGMVHDFRFLPVCPPDKHHRDEHAYWDRMRGGLRGKAQ